MKKKLIIIGIAGGSGSGKSSIAKYISKYYDSKKCGVIEVDSYYHDLKHISMSDREKTNFDHPDSIDFELMINDLNNLRLGKKILVPIYDYKSHTRTGGYKEIKEQNIIIIEGLFALLNEKIRSFIDIKIFVDTAEEIRLKRRIRRDMRSRRRTYDSIIHQYNNSVKPMYDNYIAPTKKISDFIIRGGVKNTVAMEQLISKITDMNKNKI